MSLFDSHVAGMDKTILATFGKPVTYQRRTGEISTIQGVLRTGNSSLLEDDKISASLWLTQATVGALAFSIQEGDSIHLNGWKHTVYRKVPDHQGNLTLLFRLGNALP